MTKIITKSCKTCNKEYSTFYKNKGKFCSTKCQGVDYSFRVKNGNIIPSWKDRKHTEESKRQISVKMNGNSNANHRGDRQSFYKNQRFDSSWESATAKYFDNNNIHWIYGKIKFTLSCGKTYLPDFAIIEDGNICKFVEVKGFFREQNKKKFEMFKLENPNIKIELWDKVKLKELNIIDSSGYAIN